MLSYFHGNGCEPLHYKTLGQLLSDTAQQWPDTEAFVTLPTGQRPRRSITYSQLNAQVDRLAAGFLQLGLKPGDRVAFLSPNSAEWVVTALAAARAGLLLVSMNPAYTVPELEYCLRKVEVKAVVTEESFKTQQYYSMMSQILPGLSDQAHNTEVSSDALPNLNYVIVISETHFPGAFRFADVMNSTDSVEKLREVEKTVQPEDLVNIQFTSGTTGKPKAVPISHFRLVNNSYFLGKRIGVNLMQHKILAQLPFFHVFGFLGAVMISLNFGMTIVLASPTYSTTLSCEAIKRERCTMLIGTPTMYVDLCARMRTLPPDEQQLMQSPELVITGGALCPPELIRSMADTFSCHRITSVYGMTETCGGVFQTELHDSEVIQSSTVGRVSDHIEVKIVDSEGRVVPLGEPGELCVKSYGNLDAYWDDPENTEKTFQGKWIKTGDIFVLLENGYGKIVGRMKDMIIRGGENISPKEVEDVLSTHPLVVEVQVFGVSNKRLGEEVACCVRLAEGADSLTVSDVQEFCKGKIAAYKIPAYVNVVKEFTVTSTGKIQKFVLKHEMEQKLQSI